MFQGTQIINKLLPSSFSFFSPPPSRFLLLVHGLGHGHQSHLLTVRAEGADPPHPPYGQPDRKKTVFFTTALIYDLRM